MMKEDGEKSVKDKQPIPEPPPNLSGVLEPIPEPPLNISGVLEPILEPPSNLPRVLEPIPEPYFNLSDVLKRLPLSLGLPERFGSAMARNILSLFHADLHQHQEEDPFLSFDDDEDPLDQEQAGGEEEDLKEESSVEVLAGLIASATIASALRETCSRGKPIQGWNPPPPSQLECTAVGSLDYPDAPPTSPVVPEQEREGRGGSFSRRLNDGLAREFLPTPSPPPPKPKDRRSEGGPLGNVFCTDDDHRVALVEHVVRSLSMGDPHGEELSSGFMADRYGGDGGEGAQRQQQWDGAKMAAYMEDLTEEIMEWVTGRVGEGVMDIGQRRSTEASDDGEGRLHCMADRLAHSIVTSSLRKVTMAQACTEGTIQVLQQHIP
ncbi:uncharacterized protein si:dkey-171c9.3 [Gadus morhua]|uniref:uncharacterized protein si:dkey-171c9.3 n=1 Tax=Gadus morhua TaxID=8049 RepID=UPI0011B64EC5|nr:uncharacterized protein LOC115529739 [Gadus morhua]